MRFRMKKISFIIISIYFIFTGVMYSKCIDPSNSIVDTESTAQRKIHRDIFGSENRLTHIHTHTPDRITIINIKAQS